MKPLLMMFMVLAMALFALGPDAYAEVDLSFPVENAKSVNATTSASFASCPLGGCPTQTRARSKRVFSGVGNPDQPFMEAGPARRAVSTARTSRLERISQRPGPRGRRAQRALGRINARRGC